MKGDSVRMTNNLTNQHVNVYVIPTDKYKTIQLMIRFTTKMTRKNASLRTLLGSMLETNSLNYPTQTEVSKKLSDMYGARMSINCNKKGNMHYLNAVLTIVNPHYLPDEKGLLNESVDFLKEMLFSPNMIEGRFDEATFEREKKNLQSYIQSIYDDKQSQAALSLQELYFSDDVNQQTPGFGRAEDVSKITNEDLVSCYQEMLTEDMIDIMVIGDVQEEEIYQALRALPLDNNKGTKVEAMYRQSLRSEVLNKVETLPVQQGKLNLGYQTGVYFHDEDYFALQIFNGLFGGFPHSKLFTNVREKESMAYYASSSIDTFRGMMTVQTGIDSQNKEKVLNLIQEQLTALIEGDITKEDMLQTKAMLRNQYLLSLDNPSAIVESVYLKKKFPASNISDEEWLSRLEAVTLEDVKQVAANVQLQAIYFMEGSL